jgi:hypothetical protein
MAEHPKPGCTPGRGYLTATLQKHPPAVIIAAGKHVRHIMHAMHKNDIPAYKSNNTQRGTMNTRGRAVPWFGAVAPTAHSNRFHDDMFYIRREIRAAII